ncbi:hypothetical protein R1sor_020891 [Riccia sorocarpa]|uniref:Uncharacterized protein n=1 Tax=Riccia sorocarpa TaxID=122646 RepID=A0ABD3GIT9_9MARC
MDGKIRKVDTHAKRLLWEDGDRHVGDLTKVDGAELAVWEERRFKGAERNSVKAAYSKTLMQLTTLEDTRLHKDEKINWFFEDASDPYKLWEWKISGRQKMEQQNPPIEENACRCYCAVGRLIQPCKITEEPVSNCLYNPEEVIKFKVGHGKTIRVRAGDLPEGARELAKCRWANDCAFFAAANDQIRRMLTSNKILITEKLQRWSGVANTDPGYTKRWAKIWRPGRARKESYLLWSICLRIVPTNAWRFPSLPRSDSQRWCKRCRSGADEDIILLGMSEGPRYLEKAVKIHNKGDETEDTMEAQMQPYIACREDPQGAENTSGVVGDVARGHTVGNMGVEYTPQAARPEVDEFN